MGGWVYGSVVRTGICISLHMCVCVCVCGCYVRLSCVLVDVGRAKVTPKVGRTTIGSERFGLEKSRQTFTII